MKLSLGKSLWDRLPHTRMVKKVVGDLAGAKARQELLGACGYAKRPEGLAARLGVELERHLPLNTSPEAVAEFGRYFDQLNVQTLALVEAREPLPRLDASIPASQVELAPSQWRRLWPWLGGQRFLRLARAHLVGRDAALAAALAASLSDFCRFNPPLMGPAWASAGLMATRSLNWLLALRMIGDPVRLGAEVVVSVLMHLALVGQVLAEDLAQAPGRAAPAAALLLLGRSLPFLPQAESWRSQGQAKLLEALAAYGRPGPPRPTRQLGLDTHWAALAGWALGRDWARDHLAETLAPLALACRSLAEPWGPGRGWGYDPVRSVLEFDSTGEPLFGPGANLAAVVLGQARLRAHRRVDEGLFWLIGPEAAEWLRQLAGGGDPGAGDLPGAGLSWLAAEAGGRKVGLRLCSAPRQAAGPGWGARSLDLSVSLDGQPLLALPGPPAEGPLAGVLEARAAHSVVRVDAREPGPGRVRIEGLESTDNHLFISLAFDGYARLPDPVNLRRRVHLDRRRGVITVVDQISAGSQHQVELLFQLPPGAQARPLDQGGLELDGDFGRYHLAVDQACRVEVLQGRTDPALGWRSTREGQTVPSPVVRLVTRQVGDVTLTTVFTPLA